MSMATAFRRAATACRSSLIDSRRVGTARRHPSTIYSYSAPRGAGTAPRHPSTIYNGGQCPPYEAAFATATNRPGSLQV